MPVLSRRSMIAGFGLAAAGTPAMAAPGRMMRETGSWTGGLLLDGSGASFVLSDLRKPLALLKLWAHWCPACLAEMPQLAAGAAAMRNVDVILVSHPEYWEADQAAARRRSLPFRLATFAPTNSGELVQQALTDGAGRYVVPRSLVFRQRDYAIVSEREGSMDWSSASAVSQMKGLLG